VRYLRDPERNGEEPMDEIQVAPGSLLAPSGLFLPNSSRKGLERHAGLRRKHRNQCPAENIRPDRDDLLSHDRPRTHASALAMWRSRLMRILQVKSGRALQVSSPSLVCCWHRRRVSPIGINTPPAQHTPDFARGSCPTSRVSEGQHAEPAAGSPFSALSANLPPCPARPHSPTK
jgi:hypothetical protein